MVTLLFDEGPTEIVSVTAEDLESGNLDDRIVGQFSRDRNQHGSAVVRAQVQGTDMNNVELIKLMSSQAFQTDQGRNGLTTVISAVVGKRDDNTPIIKGSALGLDAPFVHLTGARALSDEAKLEVAGRIETGVINSGEDVDILSIGFEQ